MSTITKKKNQINILYPYRTRHGGWSFDDEDLGIVGEPFVMGIPQIIDGIVGERNSFEVLISKDPIANNWSGKLVKISDNQDGWYTLEGTNLKGWLCPCLLNYFDGYPDNIYFKIN